MAYDDNTVERWKRNGPKLGQVIAKTWSDEQFKQQLLADPNGVLSAAGVEIPNGVTVKVVEETDQQTYLVLPTKPADLDVSDLQGSATLDNCLGGCMPSWCF